MRSKEKKGTFFTLLLSGFIDYAGIALVYPIFAYLLFDPSYHFFTPETSDAIKGLWLGVLIALYPLMQFFSSPVLGALSDRKGRKRLLLISLVISFSGYLFAIWGVLNHSLFYLALYRILVGIGAGNGSIISASVADLSTKETKGRNFGLLSMSFGAGFTIAPFFGGFLVNSYGYLIAFVLPLALVLLNALLVIWKLHDSCKPVPGSKVSLFMSFSLLKRAASFVSLKGLFLSLLIFTIGWAFFTEFCTLFLVDRFDFKPEATGVYFGFAGLCYALSAGFLAPMIAKKIGAGRALCLSQLLSGVGIMALIFIRTPLALWIYTPLLEFLMSFVYPTTSTVISNRVSSKVQGEAMGIYQAINALAIALSPFFGGALVGAYPWVIVVVGGVIMSLGGVAFLLYHRPHTEGVPLISEVDS